MIQLTIPGKPIAKARPRFYRRGKHVGTYNSQETEEGRFMLECHRQLNGHKPITGPITIHVTFYMPRPKSHYGTGRNAGKLKPSAPQYHIVKPDKDNLTKFLKDCLNGIVWKDDCQVYASNELKQYDGNPRTEVFIFEAPRTLDD